MSALQPSGSTVPQWVRYIGAAVWISGPDRRIGWMNAHAERLLGRCGKNGRGECGDLQHSHWVTNTASMSVPCRHYRAHQADLNMKKA